MLIYQNLVINNLSLKMKMRYIKRIGHNQVHKNQLLRYSKNDEVQNLMTY